MLEIRKRSHYRYPIYFCALLFCFFNFSVLKLYGFSIFPDEYSYWAYAAKLGGYDWSEVTSLGSFYAWGYSLLLFPLFVVFRNALTAYRVALAVNFLMIGGAYAILCSILKRMDAAGGEDITVCAAVAMFYPPLLFYAQTTMAETLLAFGYLAFTLLFVKCLQDSGPLRISLFLAVGVYLYLVHMRAIGIVTAGIGLLLYTEIRYRKNHRKAIGIMLLSLALIFAIHVLQERISAVFYRNINDSLYRINTLEGQLEKIKYIFSVQGLIAFINGFCGKLLYLGISSFGIACVGIAVLCRECRYALKKEASFAPHSILCAFILLSTLSQVLISTVYNVMPDSYDSVTYGRYQDYITPLLIAVGLIEILRNAKWAGRCLLVSGAAIVFLTVVVCRYCTALEVKPIKGYFMAGMSIYEPAKFETMRFYFISCAIGIAGMLFLFLVYMLRNRTGISDIVLLWLVLQMLIAIQLGRQYLYPFNALARQDIQIAQRADTLVHSPEYEDHIVYMDYNEISAIGLLQFILRDTKIEVYSGQDSKLRKDPGDRAVVILGANDPRQSELEEKYDTEVIMGHMVLLYNE